MAKKALKPSQAMAIGMKKSRPTTDCLYREGGHQRHPMACALGAIALGYGFTKDEIGIEEDILEASEMDYRLTSEVAHPAVDGDDRYTESVGSIIVDLNDNHLWGRKKILNWLKRIGL